MKTPMLRYNESNKFWLAFGLLLTLCALIAPDMAFPTFLNARIPTLSDSTACIIHKTQMNLQTSPGITSY